MTGEEHPGQGATITTQEGFDMQMTTRQKLFTAIACAVLCGTSAAQAQNVGRCGWGSKLFEGNDGIAPQVLAVLTNGVLGNQTFAISSGTSGCTHNGVVRSNWKSVHFIEQNKTILARDIATGEGETFAALADVLNVKTSDRQHFFSHVQSNFDTVFVSEDATAGQVASALQHVLADDAQLKQYAPAV